MCYNVSMVKEWPQSSLNRLHELISAFNKKIVASEAAGYHHGCLTISQMSVLKYIVQSNIPTMTDIGGYFDIKLSSVTSMMDRLEKEGFLKRFHDPADKRIVRVKATKKGIKAIKVKTELWQRHNKFIFRVLSVRERKMFLKILTKVLEAANKAKKGAMQNEA
ncbi:MAG: MarR family transcriptional regulator [Candidatus Saganbacteria bacterium]|nr:MarR family transcriptional regulator [Candidatus Saganbacteria bacterium]